MQFPNNENNISINDCDIDPRPSDAASLGMEFDDRNDDKDELLLQTADPNTLI